MNLNISYDTAGMFNNGGLWGYDSLFRYGGLLLPTSHPQEPAVHMVDTVLALCCCDTCESGIGHWTIFFCSKRATEQYTNLSRTETSPQDFYWRRNMNLELLGNVKLFI